MSVERMVVLAAAAGLSLAAVMPAQAQQSLGGNAVPGVCMMSRQEVIGTSKVGQAADARLKQLAENARQQLDKDREPLRKDIQAFQSKAGSMSEAERKKQGQALQERMQHFQQKAHDLGERVQLTRGKVMQRIGNDAEPVVQQVYKQHHCGLLLDRDSVLGGNMSHDITDDVVKGLNAKTKTISFNLEPLPKNNGK
ncbi:OmpH family outer membrane protein [Oleiagrimonas sp. C23AA]|uniref:OmpH family outer membrane protein n=1 Tax=Oleiagrimonas sp. C23AA TaxID=2719047 RepID=UPI0014211366|nr:OmpH family outer membrane protein [Oleiagrimonas sp. C23AA]NII11281.1 OmpH family outer membrane protein [Oleiagrimonas sp. C23AA]